MNLNKEILDAPFEEKSTFPPPKVTKAVFLVGWISLTFALVFGFLLNGSLVGEQGVHMLLVSWGMSSVFLIAACMFAEITFKPSWGVAILGVGLMLIACLITYAIILIN